MNGLLRIRQRYQGLPRVIKNWRIICCYNLIRRAFKLSATGQRSRSQSVQRREFAQKLGYKGFPALKLALSEAWQASRNRPQCPFITKSAVMTVTAGRRKTD